MTKRILLMLTLLVSSLAAMAQDVIVKTDGSTILSKVIEITETQIKYKKHTNPKGQTYSVPKSEVKCINYADGSRYEVKASASEPVEQPVVTEVTPPLTTSSGQQTMSDTDLWKMAELPTTEALLKKAKKQKMSFSLDEALLKKAKKQRMIGWIGGGCLVALGAVSMINAYNDEIRTYDHTGLARGLQCMGAGVVWTSSWLLIANHTKKKAQTDTVQAAPVLQQEFVLGNGQAFYAGIDAIRDNVSQQSTFGLGLRYQF